MGVAVVEMIVEELSVVFAGVEVLLVSIATSGRILVAVVVLGGLCLR